MGFNFLKQINPLCVILFFIQIQLYKMESITQFMVLWNTNPLMVLQIILSLVLIEALLSVDNAAVLATMVRSLPLSQQDKALKYGLFGAYAFRGLAMVFASVLIKFAFLKYIGGAYLIYLAAKWFVGQRTETENDDIPIETSGRFYDFIENYVGQFWATVALVEVMDMTFSIDNVFAAVAFTDNIVLICAGVFIGILAMRFVAQAFIKLMDKYSFLEYCAYIVIAVLGVKLCLGVPTMFMNIPKYKEFIEGEFLDGAVSIGTLAIFIVPVLTSIFFNYPKNKQKQND